MPICLCINALRLESAWEINQQTFLMEIEKYKQFFFFNNIFKPLRITKN